MPMGSEVFGVGRPVAVILQLRHIRKCPGGAAFAAAGRAAGPKARPEAGASRLPNAAPWAFSYAPEQRR